MRKCSKDLSFEERQSIYLLRSDGKGIREIGRYLNRSASCISRELSRFKGMSRIWRRTWKRLPWYEKARHAHLDSLKNRSKCRNRGWSLKNELIRQYVYENLKRGLSPKRISLRLKIEHPGHKISHESIYQYVFNVARELIPCLKRCSKKGRVKRSSGKKRRGVEQNKRRIDSRPESVDKRLEFGHNESDLIVSGRGGKNCLLVFVERKTRRAFLRKVANREAKTVRRAIFQILHALPASARRSLTVDNGKEHQWLPELEPVFKEDGFLVYYCNPYAAWERGTVEAINGVIREKFPKRTNFDSVSDAEVQEVEDWLNDLPMECHDGYTMKETFEREINKLAA